MAYPQIYVGTLDYGVFYGQAHKSKWFLNKDRFSWLVAAHLIRSSKSTSDKSTVAIQISITLPFLPISSET